MIRSGYLIGAALMLSLAGCKDEKAGNEAQQSAKEAKLPANQAQQAANKKNAAATTSPNAKCPFVYTQLPPVTPGPTRKVYTCVERYAHLYSKGPDGAEILSKAVMAKCKDAVVQYVDQEAKKAGVKPPYKEAFESWQAHTLPIIAEARARACYAD